MKYCYKCIWKAGFTEKHGKGEIFESKEEKQSFWKKIFRRSK